jgi:hypothetical protein
MPQRIIPPPWVATLANELAVHQAEGDTSMEALMLRAQEVKDRGPAEFKALAEQARVASLMLGLQWSSAANWLMVKSTAMPFRMLQAMLDIPGMGIAVNYTVGALVAGRNPTISKDFVDIRLDPLSNYLVLVHAGTVLKASEVLEILFRRAFVGDQSTASRPASTTKGMIRKALTEILKDPQGF